MEPGSNGLDRPVFNAHDTRIGTLTTIVLGQAIAVLPMYLIAASAPVLMSELSFEHAGLGIATSSYFFSAAILAVPAGRLVDRLGPRTAVRMAVVTTSIVMAVVATIHSWFSLVACLTVAGFGMSLVQPATNVALAATIPRMAMGRAFGIKQSAVPLASIIAGASLPFAQSVVGWRTTFAVAAALAMILVVALRRLPTNYDHDPKVDSDPPQRGLFTLAASIMLATTGVSAMSSFYVESITARGLDSATAGLFLSVGGFAAITGRIVAGMQVDKHGQSPIRVISMMMLPGAAAIAALGLVENAALLLVCTLIAFGLGWGWNGLFQLAAVRLNPRHPGTASGSASLGLRLGGIVGPSMFGVLIIKTSYAIAWVSAAICLAASAQLLSITRRAVEASPDQELNDSESSDRD